MDYSTFLEISFAVNTLFCAWDNPSKKFVDQLLASVKENKKKHLQPSENVAYAPKLSWDSLAFALTIGPAPLTWAYIYCAYRLCLCKNKKTMQKLGEQLKRNRSTYKEAVSKIIQG